MSGSSGPGAATEAPQQLAGDVGPDEAALSDDSGSSTAPNLKASWGIPERRKDLSAAVRICGLTGDAAEIGLRRSQGATRLMIQ
mmetsp:Transcript_122459/g.261298  ORF Transcript_122459/g.261298 Transcript_122459/m.261298 type:complete len:84 (-) Transcript_122459:17-268(-)